jgi:hypothetical protein
MSKSLFILVKKNQPLVRLGVNLAAIVALVLSPLILLVGQATAAQITVRSLTLSTAQAAATGVTYTVGASTGGTDTTSGFFFGTSHIVKGMKLQACTTPVGTCTAPSGLTFAAAAGATLTGWQDATAFSFTTTNTNDCDGTQTNIICISRAGATTPEDTTHSHKIVFTGITNPDATYVNKAFFIRMSTYTTSNYTAPATDTGTVASAIVQTLTVKANVAEVLNFCIGATTVDDATTDPTNSGNHDCSVISGTSVNIGTLDSGTVNVSPVSTNGGDGNNGIAMVRSNAANGVNIYYKAIQASTGTNHLGTLRITGASCNAGNVNTDGCINAQGTTQGTFTAGVEKFGMTVAGVNCGSTTSYTCTFSTGAYDLVPQTNYVGQSGNTFCALATCNSAGNGFAWDESGTAREIASSASSTIPQVDDEALILKFAATSNIITPFGAYSVQADFIAVPTY